MDLWLLQTSRVQVEILTLGATIKSLSSRGKDGQMADVVLGFDSLEGKMNPEEAPCTLTWNLAYGQAVFCWWK